MTQLALNTLYSVRPYTIYPKQTTLTEPPPFSKGSDLTRGLPTSEPPLPDGGFALVKTHELPYPGDRAPAVYILRDGRDAYVSYAHFALTYHADLHPNMSYLDVLEMLIRSKNHFGGWSAHVEGWTKRTQPTALIRYEEMLSDPAGTVSRACASLGMELKAGSGTMPGFDEEHARNPSNVRKGQIGSWREEMPPHLESLFWSLHGSTMEKFGYSR